METILNNISINHFLVSFLDFHDLFLHLRFKNLIKVSIWALFLFLSHFTFLLKPLVHEHLESGQLYDSSVGVLFGKISIVNWVASKGTCQSCWISTIVMNSIDKIDEVTCRFGHFLSLYQNITVTVISLRPEFGIIPNSDMVVQSHGQMIFYQIFSWTSQIHWVPVQEGFSYFVYLELGNFLWSVLFTQKDKVPEVRGDILVFNT